MLRPGTFALTALLAAMSAIGPLTTDMYLPALPDIVRLLDGTTAEGQLTVSAYLIGFAVGQIVYGPASDRHGRKPVLLTAVGIYCVASLLCALSVSLEMLIAARALQAFGGCGGIVLARAIVRDLYSGARAGRELSMIGSVMALAPMIAPVIGGLIHSAFGWQSTFFTLVFAGLAGVVIIWRLLPETLVLRAADPVSLSSMLASYRIVARDRTFLAYLGLGAACYAGLFAWISASSFVLQNLYGLKPVDFGIAFALGSCGYLIGTMIASRLVMRIGIGGTIGVGGLALTAGGLLMVAAIASGLTSAASLVLPMAVYLAGLGMVLPQSIAGAMTPFPERAGAASALFGFIQQIVASLCGVAVGHWLGASAWPLALAIAVTGSTCLIVWLLTRETRARDMSH